MLYDAPRVLRALVSIAIAAAMSAAFATAANTAEAKTSAATAKAKPRSGWRVQCNDAGSGIQCRMVQAITMRRTRQRLVTASIQRNKDGKGAAVLYQLPHGLFLPDGVQIAIDKGRPKALPIQTCDRRGCYAGTPLAASDLSNMRKGKAISIAFKNLSKKSIKINLPLLGFGPAYDKLK